MIVFYERVSTVEQNEARQSKLAEEYGAERIFCDKASGKNTNRPELNAMLEFIREGDTLVVESISRLARSTRDLLGIVSMLESKHVTFISQKESIDTKTPQGRFMLTVFAAMAELERENILQRQAEGIAIAKQQGKYKGRKPKELDEAKWSKAVKAWQKGERTAVSIQKEFGISAPTFYKRVGK